VSDFKLKVIAETQTAERSLKQVGEVADKATKARSLDIKVPSLSGVTKTFQTLERDVKSAANTINTFYKVGKALPGNFGESVRAIENVGKGAAKSAIALNNNNTAAEIFSNTLKSATGAAGQLVTTLAKVGFATFAIKETVGVLQAAFNGFFNNTIGREIKLRETILKTQTTLASTNKVFKDGKEITDPYQKIVTLTGAVRKNIDSIRERSIALAGVTSNEVIEVFGIVASQVGQIGGGLQDAEDLAISFSAALGTFGLPLQQARQEIGSILRGDVGPDSYLAKALGITSPDIAKAKTETGGVVKFVQDRLAAAVAGQKIAALGFSGVVSNIVDLGELVGQNFGRGMLQPLLNSLTAVFETLFRIRTQIFDIASKAGETVGRVGTLVVGLTAGRTGVGKGVDASAAASAAAGVANKAFTEIETVAQRTVGAISQVILSLKPTALILADAFSNVAKAFVQIKVGTFEALASAIATLAIAASAVAPPFASIINLYTRFLGTPIVQYFAEISAVLGLLKRAGLDALTSLILFGRFVVGTVIPVMGGLGTALSVVVGAIAAVGLAVANLVVMFAGLAAALVTPAAAIPAVAAALGALSASLFNVGNQGIEANTKLATLSKTFTTLGATAKAAGASIAASLGWLVAIQVGIAIAVDAFGRYKRAQEDAASSKRALEALRQLQTTYKDVGDTADSATKSARDFKRAIVDAEYNKGLARLEEIRQKIEDIREELKPGTQNFGEFIASLAFTDTERAALAKGEIAELEAERQRIQALNAKVNAARDKATGEENVVLEAQKRTDLSKEYAELQRQQQSDLFQQRQTLAQKEVEIFRAAGELRIFQMEQANAKLIEGEEGASRTALEALNNYLSVRENGELEIEASKKDIAIEVANLEKTIADYRFENEKKIAEIRKRAGENEKAMADARRQAEGQAPVPGGAGPLSQLIGSVESYGGDYTAYNRRGSNRGRTAHGSGKDPNLLNMTIADIQGRQLASNVPASQRLHATGKYQIIGSTLKGLMAGNYGDTGVKPTDKYSPENQEKLFAALARNRVVPGNEAATMKGLRQEWVGLQKVPDAKLRPATQALMTGGAAPGAAAAAPTPALQSLDVAGPAVEAYTEAVRGLGSALERQRKLQAAITDAKTAAEFEKISKAAFPQVALEGYQDALHEVQLTYTAVAASAGEAFDPERSAIEITRLTAVNASNRELGQILDGIAKRDNLTAQQKKSLQEAYTKEHSTYLKALEKEAAFKKQILDTQRVIDLTINLNDQTASIYKGIAILKKRNELQFQGVDPAIIAGEEQKLRIQEDVDKMLNHINSGLRASITLRDELAQRIGTATGAEKTDLEKQLADAQARITELEGLQGTADLTKGAIDAQTAAETEPGAKIRAFIGDAKRELADLDAVAVRVSQSIGDAIGNSLANGITGLIEGTTTAKEVFANFLKSIGQILIQEGTKMIAMYIAIAIAKAIAGMSGGVSGANSASAIGTNPNMQAYAPLADGGTFANGIATFAKGGAFTNSIVSSPTLFKFADGGTTQMGEMGEAGPEAIMPLSRGRGGRLGVDASGLREAMGRPPGGSSGSPVLNMSFQSTTINGVEYVSREQLESAMAETRRNATRDGAKRGMTMTLDRIQNSSSTRRKAGI
jgi:hypothetical protein